MVNLLRVVVAITLFSMSLSGALITSAPSGGTTTTFPGGGSCFTGPSSATVAGFPISASGDACYFYGDASHNFGLGGNGTWNMGLIGDNSQAGTTSITIDLGGLYSSAGGFVNYFTPSGVTLPSLSAIAADGTTVLETYNLAVSAPISTGAGSVNDGAFRGIQLASASIRYLKFGGSDMVMHNITLVASAVPEPSTAFLAGAALAMLGLLRRVRVK